MLFVALGTAVTILSKAIAFIVKFKNAETGKELSELSVGIQLPEIFSLFSFLIIAGILYLIKLFVNNERENLVDKISNHFLNN